MLLLLVNIALAEDPIPAPPPAARTTVLGDEIEARREVSVVTLQIDNLNPTEEVKPEENFLPQIIEAVEHKPF